MGVHVRVWVLGLSMLRQNTWSNVVNLAYELEHGVIWEMLEREFTLGHVSRVGLSEDGVAVSGDDLAGIEGIPEVLFDVLIGEVVTNRLLHGREPVQDLLVSKTVEGPSKTVQAGGKGEHRGAESGPDQVSGVGRDISSFLLRGLVFLIGNIQRENSRGQSG